MTSRKRLHSFHDLATVKTAVDPGESRPPHPQPQPEAEEPEPELSDAELFLSAMGRNVDVSAKFATGGQTGDDKRSAPLVQSGSASGQTPAPLPDASLFVKAMDGVAPLRARGRDLPLPAKPLPSISVPQPVEDMFPAQMEFSLEFSDEYIQGHVLGLDPVVLAKLRTGAFSPEGHVDLHGQNLEQAYRALTVFIRQAYTGGKRHLLVITGRGRNSPGGVSVLRERVQTWFTRDPFKRVVLAFCTAKPPDGGAGALYVLLRKRRKAQGKIIWDRTPSEEDIFY